MDQNESSVPRRDACGRQRETHGRKDMTLRRRNFSFPSEERSKTLQLKIRMMNFNKFRRRKGPAWTRSEQEKARSSHSGSSKSCTLETADSNQPRNSGVREIPGFYYDPEKKRYFKITKDHPGKNFAICQDGGYKNISSNNHNRVKAGDIKVIKKPSRISILNSLHDREYSLSTQTTSRNILEKLTQLVKVRQRLVLDPCADHHLELDQFAVSRIEPDACYERILTLYETKPTGNQVVQFHDLKKDRNNKFEVVHNMAMMKNQKITGLLWSPHEQTKNMYLVSLLGYGNMSGETMIFTVEGASQRIVGRTSVQGNSVWANSWNRNPLYSNMISIGASKVALTFDVSMKRRVIHVKCQSAVLAQEFSWSNPVLYNGSRDGCIRTCDVRVIGPNWPVMRLNQGELASITCLRVLHDENYLLASGLDGSLKLWDIRARACVQDYRGHVNEITHGLRFYVDPTDSLIFAAGQDSVTRIWSIGSGKLLHTIPFPATVDRSLSPIPALYYSEEWGGKGGMPGLLYGAGDSIYSYSY
ncbi:DDB1- and CUL4-associated factor 4 isoform X2 [Pocillopora verrucosa]|uniref:DDB1- and CUL4-associated factor 4 isoform X2 n=1 Tax=Pocillopora verrucosa TaxID=203993 RepID=UPI0033415937